MGQSDRDVMLEKWKNNNIKHSLFSWAPLKNNVHKMLWLFDNTHNNNNGAIEAGNVDRRTKLGKKQTSIRGVRQSDKCTHKQTNLHTSEPFWAQGELACRGLREIAETMPDRGVNQRRDSQFVVTQVGTCTAVLAMLTMTPQLRCV